MLPTVALFMTLPMALAATPVGAPQPRDPSTVMLQSWNDATRRVVGGPGASSMFRAPASSLDVHWRLAAFDGTAPRLDPAVARDLVDLAVVSAGLGWEKTARRMLAEGSGGFAPDREIKGRTSTALADLDDPGRAAATVTRPTSLARRPTPRIRPGASLTMATSVDPSFWEERELLSLARATTWLQARHLGVDTLRVQVSTRGPETDEPWELGWLAAARHGVAPGLSALAELRGAVHTEGPALPVPPTVRGALDMRLAPERPVFLRAEAARRPRRGTSPEDRVGLSLRANLGWRAPMPPPGTPPAVLPAPAPVAEPVTTRIAAHTPTPSTR
jgi:hypothetical protein